MSMKSKTLITKPWTNSLDSGEEKKCILMQTDDCFQCLSLFNGERRTPDKTAKQVTIRACCQLHICLLLDLLFRPEDWDNIFLQSVS
jgi:hypothetical protein